MFFFIDSSRSTAAVFLLSINQSVSHHNIMVCHVSQLSNVTSQLKDIYGLHVGVQLVMMTVDMWYWPGNLPRSGGLLILYKSGIFAIDTSIVNFQTWPRHRDDLGVYWKWQKRTYQSPSHPAMSYAKCSRLQEAYMHQHVKIFDKCMASYYWSDFDGVYFLKFCIYLALTSVSVVLI